MGLNIQIKVSFFLLFFLAVQALSASVGSTNENTESDTAAIAINHLQYYSNALGIEVDTTFDLSFIEYVSGWLGTPYRFGGACRQGTDCSGFVTNVFRDLYSISLNRSSAGMYQQVKSVKRNDLQTGDLVFFKIRKGRISHVGIYLGEDKFIHASTCCGVRVDSLKQEYYRKTYYSGGRLDLGSISVQNITD